MTPQLRLPADAASLADAVAAAVQDGVRDRQLVPEHTYSAYQLADLLGVSRSPVREALLRLAEAGLVVLSRNRGFRVVVPTAHDVQEIVEIRLALEPPAARRAAEQGDQAALAVVRDRWHDLERATSTGDEPSFWAADRALHDALLRASGNRRAAAVVADLRRTTALLGPPTTATGRTLADICAEHAPVVRAVLAHDGPAAEAAMRTHLQHTGHLLTRALG